MNRWDTLERLVCGTVFIWSMGRYSSSFRIPEIIALALAMTWIETPRTNLPLLHASFYVFCFNEPPSLLQVATTPLIFGYQASDTWPVLRDAIVNGPRRVFHLLSVVSLCLALQALAYGLAGRNMQRKIFHFAAFCIFYDAPPAVFLAAQHLVYILLALSMTGIPDTIFAPFASSKDFGPGIYSHVFLLGALTYPRPWMEGGEYTRLLITVCLMDSLASIIGKWCSSRRKSCWGLIGGQMAAYAAEYLALGTVDVRYHGAMGLVEYYADMNDNILLPVVAVCYSRCRSL